MNSPRSRARVVCGRLVLGPLDRLVVGDAVDHVAGDQLVVDAAIGADVVVLQVHQRDLRIPPRQAVAGHVALDPLALDHPVELAVELHGVGLELLHDVGPAQQHVLADRVGGHRVDVAGGVLEVLHLQLQRRDGAPVLQLDRLLQRRVVGDVADGLHRRLQRVVAVEEAVLDHVQHDARWSRSSDRSPPPTCSSRPRSRAGDDSARRRRAARRAC